MGRQQFHCEVNGERWEGEIDSRTTLLDFLRDQLGLTGSKLGCGEAKCGACTVLVDGAPIKSCHVLALQVAGATVETVESLTRARLHDARDLTTEGLAPSYDPLPVMSLASEDLSPLQRAFWQHGAVQCGFCTAGWLMAAKGYLAEHPNPTLEQLRVDLNGNFCRCTGYQKILEAILDAAAEMSRTPTP